MHRTVFYYDQYGGEPEKREAGPAPPIVACEEGDGCAPWIVTREAEPEPLRPMDPGNEYLACYWGYTGGKVKRGEPIDNMELEKRCGKAKREARPMTDLRDKYQACYAGYTSLKAKRGEPIVEAEVEKRCSMVSVLSSSAGPDTNNVWQFKREAAPMTDLRNMYRACYAAYVSQKVKRGEPIDEVELLKRCG